MRISREAKIGFWVLTSAIILFFGLNYLKGHSIFQRYNTYYAVFENAENLSPNDKVLYRGYKVGLVQALYFQPQTGKIIVEFEAFREIPISQDAYAVVTNLDLLGTKGLVIVPGKSSTLSQNGDTLKDSLATSIVEQFLPLKNQVDSLVRSLRLTVERVKVLLEDTSALVSTFKSVGDLSQNLNRRVPLLIQDIQHTLHELDTTFIALRPPLEKSLKNLSAFSDTLTHKSGPLLTQLKDVSYQLETTLQKLNSREGTAGLLLNDTTLYQNLAQTSADLDRLLVALRKYPHRFVHFSLFGRKPQAYE
ncbi:MAG: MlaD family protein [Bacteroidia bacterium]